MLNYIGTVTVNGFRVGKKRTNFPDARIPNVFTQSRSKMEQKQILDERGDGLVKWYKIKNVSF